MENRQVARRKFRFRMRYCPLEERDSVRPKDATVVDLSDGGIRFETEEKLHIGTRLKLDFPDAPPDNQGPLRDAGIVVWSIQPLPQTSLFRTGIKYI